MGRTPDHRAIAFDSLLHSRPKSHTPEGSPRMTDLWSLLPTELAALFRPTVGDLAEEILAEIQKRVPALARPAEGYFGRTITAGIQQGVLQFVDRLADPSAPQDDRAQVFRELGLHEIIDDGTSLDVLQTAYRIGARVAWRHLSRVCEETGVPVDTLCLLAEAIFAYVDELSALSVEGHASAQAREAAAVERRRRQLLELILSTSDSSRPAVARLAEAVRWRLPARVVLVALDPLYDRYLMGPPTLHEAVLVDLEGNHPCLLVPEDARQVLDTLEADLPGWRSAVGPAVALTEATESLHWAGRALELVRQGVLPDVPVTWFEHHMAVLWLLNDPFLAAELARSVLAPMSGLTSKQHQKLSETLLIWLETHGPAEEIAGLLGVHTQTVRYRLRQLERLFGDRLAAPGSRFEIEVALRAQRAMEIAGLV
ncbi:hypothetical protein KALB_6319 [Kutzneria albida DSM 43870]|uniref:Uncharacterized protein n=2 Tax=Kutzneria TaxID=43356 RepID=W5WNF3_9PSEU|nr:hypothetical protein KALB_6319 [Kutzneria albida DSM 43870]